MTFKTAVKVRFADVDPAGIVFYPRYFEMVNGAVEDWFAFLGLDFRTMHMELRIGPPLVRIECDFSAPSQLGDELTFEVSPVRVGRTSCAIAILVTCENQRRLSVKAVLACMNLDTRRAIPWPESLKQKMQDSTAQTEIQQ